MNVSDKNKDNRAFVFSEDLSDLEVIRYHTQSFDTMYWIPSEQAIVTNSSMVFLNAKEPDLDGEPGIISGNNAMIFRFLIKAAAMQQYCLDYINTNTKLFIKDKEMPRVATKSKAKATDLQKKAGVLLRAKQLVAYFNDQPANAEANVRQIAEYLNGLHDEADPAPIIQCSIPASTRQVKV